MADLPIDDTIDVNITNDEGTKKVTVTTDGTKQRLDCNMDGSEIIVSDSESATKYQMETDFDATGVTLNTSTDTLLYSTSSQTGTLDFVAITGSNANFEVVIEVDNVERIRITMAELAAIGLSNATNVPFWAEVANKNFRYSPDIPVGYSDGFRILAKATSTPLATVTHLILYRERITT
jgi:hypothetical protein